MDQRDTISGPDVAMAWVLDAVSEGASGDRRADLERALYATMRVRELNSVAGGMVIEALHDDGMPWRDIADVMSEAAGKAVSIRTVRRWAVPPGGPEAT